jgi:hypothetical protein
MKYIKSALMTEKKELPMSNGIPNGRVNIPPVIRAGI